MLARVNNENLRAIRSWSFLSKGFFVFIIFWSPVNFAQDGDLNSFAPYMGMKDPVLTSLAKPNQTSDLEIQSAMGQRPNFFFSDPMRKMSGAVTLPDQDLVFRSFVESRQGYYKKQSDMFSKLFFDKNTQQLRIVLRPEVAFYQWDQKADRLRTISATHEDLMFTIVFFNAYLDANGFEYFTKPFQKLDYEPATNEVILSFDTNTPRQNRDFIIQFLLFTEFLPSSVYGPVFGWTAETSSLPLKEQVAPMIEYLKNDDTFEVFKNIDQIPPAGSGPYYLKPQDLSANHEYVVYHRVPNHWREQAHPDLPTFGRFARLKYTYFSDSTVKNFALTRGDLSALVYTSKREADNVMKSLGNDFQLTELPETNNSQYSIFFNLNTVNDEKVRQAIAMVARDWEKVEGLEEFGESATPLTHIAHLLGPFPSLKETDAVPQKDLQKIASILEKTPEDLKFLLEEGESLFPTIASSKDRRQGMRKALQLLKEAGYEANSKTGRMENKDGQPLKIRMMLAIDEKSLYLPENLSALGIEVEEIRLDDAQYTESWRNLKYDLYIGETYLNAEPQPELYYRDYHSQSSQPPSKKGINDSDIDSLIDYLKTLNNLEEMAIVQRAIDKILVARAYRVPLYRFSSLWMIHDSRIQPGNVINEKVSPWVERDWVEKK